MKLVAVSQRVDFIADRSEWRDALDQRLTSWLVDAGVFPLPVPNTLETRSLRCLGQWLSRIPFDGLVLSGGNDIGECEARDTTEAALLDWAAQERLPTLGICRGMQMMAVWAGGRIGQAPHHCGVRHHLLLPDSDKEGWPLEVNSFHRFVVEVSPPGFNATAHAPDGTIEAIRHQSLPWEGWMWHPEREPTQSPVEIARFVDLLSQHRARAK